MKKTFVLLLAFSFLIIFLVNYIFNKQISQSQVYTTLKYNRTVNGVVKQKNDNNIITVSILNDDIKIKTNYSMYLVLESGDNVRVRLYHVLDKNKKQIAVQYEIVR